jgi:hypothetical protein
MSEENQAVANAVVEILDKSGPMQVSDLADELQQRGIAIPGKGDTAVLISLMHRMPNVRRLQRGTYDLRRTPLQEGSF